MLGHPAIATSTRTHDEHDLDTWSCRDRATEQFTRFHAGAGPQGRRVLVVDDNNDIADTLTMILRALGHESRSCDSCFQCLCCLEEFRPDIVLLDLCLPGCDGFEIYRQIRHHHSYRGVPVIACSALDPELCEHEKSQNCEFAAYLVKPVGLPQLEAALRQAAAATERH